MTIKEQVLAELEAVPQDRLGAVLEFVRFLNRWPRTPRPTPTILASEAILARDWLIPEEEAAWQSL
jgi:hypothetical protein